MKLFSKYTEEEKASFFMFIASFIIYAVISMTKSAYSASIAVIVGEGMFSKSAAGFINGGFYLFYGGMQLLGVGIVDKVSPVKLIYMTLIGTIVILAGMAMAKSFWTMLILWSLCGLIQFAIWPAVLRIISEYLLPEHRRKAMIYISFSYCVGMITNYLIAAIVLKISGWQMLFWVSSAAIAMCLAMWAFVVNKNRKPLNEIVNMNIEATKKFLNEKRENGGKKEKMMGFGKILALSGVLVLLVPSLNRTALDMGLKSWLPTMIIDVYGVSASFVSVLTTVLLIINLAGIFIASWLYPKRIKSPVLTYGMCFLLAMPFTILLLLIGKIHIAIIILLLTIVTTMMYAGHQFINVIIPSSFAKYNKAGSVAAVLNAVASFGGVAANIGFGVLAENYGWTTVIVLWIILVVSAMIFSFAASPLWKSFFKK